MYRNEGSATLPGDSSTKATRPPVVNAELSQLADSVGHMEKVVEELLARLAPVCVSTPQPGRGAETNARAPEPMICPVGDAIRGLRHRLTSIRESIEVRAAAIEI